jgi:D-alanyl-D-alanine carboxypeptidase/D-alanyl-D-alanine-endopeptidase (penicillin-binding protein 4)
VDARTGTVIFGHNQKIPVHPASNEKLPVSWAALTRLGPGYRFATTVLGTGERVGTVWKGDLYLRGSGDPTLTTADIGRLAASLRASGIRSVTGRIRGDETAFDRRRGADGWKRYFIGGETPPLSALVVDRAKGWPALSPPLLAARALRDALVAHGMAVTGRPGLGRAPASAIVLATDRSASLSVIVRTMNRDSDNFTAEMLLKHLGTLDGRVGTSARGAKMVLAEMAAASIPTAGVRIVDGSGLSSLDRVTAEALVAVIRAGLENPRIRTAFVGSLAVAGRSGTLRTRLPSLAGIVRGKTGTTNLACSLSGIVNGSVVFAVLQNGSPVAFWPARTAQDRFVTALARSDAQAG